LGSIIHFSQELIAKLADVEGMFHQVRVAPDDCHAVRFLWWPNNDLSKEPVDYQMLVHLFGTTSSPSCSSFCLKKTASDNLDEFEGFGSPNGLVNHRNVIATVPVTERAPYVVNLDLEDLPVERTLGVQWAMETDDFNFRIMDEGKAPTRRGILSVVSTMYDPLGLIAPINLPAKSLLQSLCKQKYGWVEEISDTDSIV